MRKLLARFRRLAAESPETGPNQISFQHFKDVVDEFDIQWQSNLVLKNLFEAFDVSQSGTINFPEFTMGLSMCSCGSPQDKLALAFQIYDVDNCGSIAKEEMVEVLSSIHAKAGDCSGVAGKAESREESKAESKAGGKDCLPRRASKVQDARTLVQVIFDKADEDRNGRLTYDEFLQAALKHPELVSMVLPGGQTDDSAAAAAAAAAAASY